MLWLLQVEIIITASFRFGILDQRYVLFAHIVTVLLLVFASLVYVGVIFSLRKPS